MRKMKVFLSIGFPGARHEDVLEVEDDATEYDIMAEVREWASNYLDMGYEEC